MPPYQMRNRKDMGPNCYHSRYFIPSKFMDLCKKQCQNDWRAVQVHISKVFRDGLKQSSQLLKLEAL